MGQCSANGQALTPCDLVLPAALTSAPPPTTSTPGVCAPSCRLLPEPSLPATSRCPPRPPGPFYLSGNHRDQEDR